MLRRLPCGSVTVQPWLLPLRGRSNSRASVAVLDLCLEPSHPAS
jgi:hypothetical protein